MQIPELHAGISRMPAAENGAETILRACPDCAVTAGRRHDNKRNMPIGIGKETV